MFISVLLPAPFSPSRAWIWPGWIDRSMPSLATTPGKRLVIPRISRLGAVLRAATAGSTVMPPAFRSAAAVAGSGNAAVIRASGSAGAAGSTGGTDGSSATSASRPGDGCAKDKAERRGPGGPRRSVVPKFGAEGSVRRRLAVDDDVRLDRPVGQTLEGRVEQGLGVGRDLGRGVVERRQADATGRGVVGVEATLEGASSDAQERVADGARDVLRRGAQDALVDFGQGQELVGVDTDRPRAGLGAGGRERAVAGQTAGAKDDVGTFVDHLV